jgi:hypothetical protein
MPGALRDHTDRKSESWVGAGVAVLNEELVAFPGADQAIVNLIEDLLRHGLIDGTPINRRFGRGLANYVLVLGRTARELTGPHRQRSAVGKQTLMTLQSLLH